MPNPRNTITTDDLEKHLAELTNLVKVDEEILIRMLEIWLSTFEEKANE